MIISERMRGTIKFFNAAKGYGFIQNQDEDEIFVHIKACPSGYIPEEEDVVEYSIMHVPKGIAARSVSLVKRKSETPTENRSNPPRRVVIIRN